MLKSKVKDTVMSRKQASEDLIELRDPRFVMNQPLAMSGNELLERTYAIGEHPYAVKIGIEEYEHEKHLLQTE